MLNVDSSNFLATKRPSTCLARKDGKSLCQENKGLWTLFSILVTFSKFYELYFAFLPSNQNYAWTINPKAIWWNHVWSFQPRLTYFLQFVSSLQSLAASSILETFSTSTTFSELPIPKTLSQALDYISTKQKEVSLKNYWKVIYSVYKIPE